jgi:hypothetical protein
MPQPGPLYLLILLADEMLCGSNTPLERDAPWLANAMIVSSSTHFGGKRDEDGSPPRRLSSSKEAHIARCQR